MDKKFDVKKLKKLDNPERRRLMPPVEVLKKAGLKDGDKFADIGCGIGYFSILASSIVGENGSVLALDISQDMLDYMVQHGGDRQNIMAIKSEENQLPVSDGEVDLAFMCNVVHEVDNMHIFLEEVNRIICKNGRIAIVDFEKKVGEFGPPIEHRVASGDVRKELEELGFKVVSVESFSKEFYLVKAEKA